MCCKKFWTRVTPFSLALVFSLLTVNALQKLNLPGKNEGNKKPINKIVYSNEGIGCGECSIKKIEKFDSDKSLNFRSEKKPVQIISKPRAYYTDMAQQNNVQGTVTLRVSFKANGETGSISPVRTLPYGLTEQAILAARGIRFKPALKDGIPQTVIKSVEYNFTIY